MTRQLRPRKNKPSYAALFAVDEDEDEPRAGPSSIPRTFVEDEVDSESDFEPERKANSVAEDPPQDEDEDEDEDEDAIGEIDDEEDVVEVVKPRTLKRKRKSSPQPAVPKPKAKLKIKTDSSAKVIVGPQGNQAPKLRSANAKREPQTSRCTTLLTRRTRRTPYRASNSLFSPRYDPHEWIYCQLKGH